MGGVVGLCMVGVWLVYGVWGVLGVWCGAGRAGNDWGVVYPITSFDNFWEKVCVRGTGVANNQLRQTFGIRCGPQSASTNFWEKAYPITSFDKLLGEGEKSIREFFTKIHQTPWDTSIIYIPIIPLFEGFSTFWHAFLDEKRRR